MKWIVMIWLITGLSSAAGASELFTDTGPERWAIDEWNSTITTQQPCNNSTEMDNIQEILNKYYLASDIVDSKFDCSDISEIIWYVLETNEYDCSVVANAGIYEGNESYHMFVWVKENDGVIVVEPTWQADPKKRIGTVLRDTTEDDTFYLHAWEFGDPAEFIEMTGLTGDMMGVTTETTITDLQIRRIYTEEELEQHQVEIYKILHGDD